jgi:hypothetical protein
MGRSSGGGREERRRGAGREECQRERRAQEVGRGALAIGERDERGGKRERKLCGNQEREVGENDRNPSVSIYIARS